MRNEAGRRWYLSIGLALICTRGNFHVAVKFPGFFHKSPTQYRYWETILDFK
jgi:hypothetical protein